MEFLDLYSKNVFRADYLEFLCKANKIDVKTIVEIGTWNGRNANRLRKLFPKVQMYLIDPWDANPSYLSGNPISTDPKEFETAFLVTCKFFESDPHTTILRKTSMEALSLVPDGADIVFIDGDHSYSHVKADILAWKDKVRPGGLLSGHDYSYRHPGVIEAVNECLKGRFIVGRDSVWATII